MVTSKHPNVETRDRVEVDRKICSSQNLLEAHKVLLSCSDKVQTRVQCE